MSAIESIWAFNTPEHLSEPEVAKGALATLLKSGQLALLLGAGIGPDLGLPEWGGLVTRCAALLGDTADYSDVTSAGDLMDAIDRMRRTSGATSEQMLTTVRSALYGPAAAEAYPKHSLDVIDSRLLTALGALMMASARGSAGEVFTLNFDDVLEWYLDLHGFRSEVVCELPRTLRGDVDVHVFHIHGFLPLMRDRYDASSWMILSKRQLEERLVRSSTYPWEALAESPTVESVSGRRHEPSGHRCQSVTRSCTRFWCRSPSRLCARCSRRRQGCRVTRTEHGPD